jgi:hypothetical protein
MWVRMKKILCTVLLEAHKQQVEEAMNSVRRARKLLGKGAKVTAGRSH